MAVTEHSWIFAAKLAANCELDRIILILFIFPDGIIAIARLREHERLKNPAANVISKRYRFGLLAPPLREQGHQLGRFAFVLHSKSRRPLASYPAKGRKRWILFLPTGALGWSQRWIACDFVWRTKPPDPAFRSLAPVRSVPTCCATLSRRQTIRPQTEEIWHSRFLPPHAAAPLVATQFSSKGSGRIGTAAPLRSCFGQLQTTGRRPDLAALVLPDINSRFLTRCVTPNTLGSSISRTGSKRLRLNRR